MDHYEVRTFKTSEMSPVEMQQLVEYVKPMFLWFAPGSTIEDIRGRLCQHPETSVMVVFTENDHPCAFGVTYCETFDGLKVLYRGGTVVDEKHRSKGLYKLLVSEAFESEKPNIVITRTQNPRVYESLLPFVQSIHPSLDDKDSPADVFELAKAFSHSGKVEKDLLVREVYADLRKEKSFRFAKDPAINKYFLEKLGDIDAFMVVAFL